jgi:hypothetical protein
VLLIALPDGVATEIGPDPAFAGTVVEMLVEVAEVRLARVPSNSTRSFASRSNPDPEIVTVAPTFAITGLNDVMDGVTVDIPTVKEALLVAVPLGEVTVIGPVVAPLGTVTTICPVVAEVTEAVTLPNVTASCWGFALNEVPEIVTAVPMGPLLGVKSKMDSWPAVGRLMLRMFPTAS